MNGTEVGHLGRIVERSRHGHDQNTLYTSRNYQIIIKFIDLFENTWRDGSLVISACCSSEGPEFSSQHTHTSGDSVSFHVLCGDTHTHTHKCCVYVGCDADPQVFSLYDPG